MRCLPPKPNDRSPSLPGPFPTCFLIPCKLTLSRTWPSPQLVCPLGQDKEWRAAWASPAQPPDAFRKATRKQQETGLQRGPLMSWPQESFCSGSKECSGELPWWLSGWESACQCRGHGFESQPGRIPQAMEQLGPCATTTEPVL